MFENVKNFFEMDVKKVISGTTKKENLLDNSNINKQFSKIFGVSLCEICQEEASVVPFIVHDICNYIKEKYIHCEGIFRLSASSIQTTKLRKAYENHASHTSEKNTSVCASFSVDGHTAANVLKQFLRQLAEPLIPNEILTISQETKCVSDETFSTKVRSHMETWPESHKRTLQFLLNFLQPVMRNVDNRMNATGLAVVFGPNVFRLPAGIEILEMQTLANRTFERLLRTYEIITKDDVKDDQGYLKLTSSPSLKPARPAPPVPRQFRPLPPPPVPLHTSHESLCPNEPVPFLPSRSKSLSQLGAELEFGDFKPAIDGSVSSSDRSENEDITFAPSIDTSTTPSNGLVDMTISKVVRKRLFTAESTSSAGSVAEDETNAASLDFCEKEVIETTLFSPTLTRNSGPKRRKPSRRMLRKKSQITFSGDHFESEEILPIPMPRKHRNLSKEATKLSLPETNNLMITEPPVVHLTINSFSEVGNSKETNPPDIPTLVEVLLPPDVENESFLIPKVIVEDFSEEDAPNGNNDFVPPLDLSGVASSDLSVSNLKPETSNRVYDESLSRARRRRRRKESKSNSYPVKECPQFSVQTHAPLNESIDIPVLREETDYNDHESSQSEGSLKWRDAWSTDEEALPTTVARDEEVRHGYIDQVEEDIDRAPSSPENQAARHHSPYSQRHRRRHHRHDKRLSPKNDMSSSADDEMEGLESLMASLQVIMEELDKNRKKNGRPEDLTLMTRDEIKAEKLAMQKELLKHEERHGRPNSKVEKELMRIIYERYRTVKRLLADSTSSPFKKRQNRRIDGEDPTHELGESDEFVLTSSIGTEKNQSLLTIQANTPLSVSGDLEISDLEKKLSQAKGEKKRLRKKLKEFENELERECGRRITQADKVVMTVEYNEYRDLKSKIRLLSALIEKQKM